MRQFRIHDRAIGPDHPPYIIAELGVNHDGSPERALELTRLAANAGADAVKVQVFRAEMLMGRAARLATYQRAAGETDPFEMLRRLELSWEAFEAVVTLAHELGMHAIATVFSVPLVEPAMNLRGASGRGFDAWKTASPDIVHRPLLEALGDTGRPLIVSTGAATLDEVSRAVGWLGQRSVSPALLQCVSSYPTPMEHAALEGIPALLSAHSTLVIGYSDHTPLEHTGAIAVSLGARILEKHFTEDRGRAGPDHSASLEAAGFRRYADAARAAFVQRTPPPPIAAPSKRVLEIERDVRGVSRQSIVAARDLPAGHVVAREDVEFKRPGSGLEPWRVGEVVGRRLGHAVDESTPITHEHVG